jgi:predicted Zn-dependent protease
MDKAITHLNIAIASDANQPLWYYNLGRALDKKGHLAEAESNYKKSLLLDN